MNSVLNTIIIDDEKLSLDGMCSLVDTTSCAKVVGKFSDAQSALDYILNNQVDLVFTDIRMPVHDGLWLVGLIEKLKRNINIVIVSAYDDKEYLFKAVKSPVVYDYITKPFIKSEFIELVNAVSNYHNSITLEMKNMNVNALVSNIRDGNINEVETMIDNYLTSTTHNVQGIKNRAYGWIMYIQNNIFGLELANQADKLALTMQKIFDAYDSKGIKEAVMPYIIYCCKHNQKDQTITVLIASAVKVLNAEISNQNLNLNYVADKLGVTPNYLSSRFSRDMKQSFTNYLTKLRIEKAKELLASVTTKIYEVAIQTGFQDVTYFNKVFKDNVGIAPSQYRMNILSEDEN